MNRQDFMDFFRNDELLNTLTPDDRAEVFSTILLDNSDFTKEFLDEILSDYGVANLEIRDLSQVIKDAYVLGVCPDCQVPIPDDIVEGGECLNCGHVFWLNCPDDGIAELECKMPKKRTAAELLQSALCSLPSLSTSALSSLPHMGSLKTFISVNDLMRVNLYIYQAMGKSEEEALELIGKERNQALKFHTNFIKERLQF